MNALKTIAYKHPLQTWKGFYVTFNQSTVAFDTSDMNQLRSKVTRWFESGVRTPHRQILRSIRPTAYGIRHQLQFDSGFWVRLPILELRVNLVNFTLMSTL